jgi:hypothetical protein
LRQLASLTLGGLQAKLVCFHSEEYPVDLHIFLIFNVLLDDRQWRTTHTGYKITMGPQSRDSAFQSRELLAKQRRTTAFDSLHKGSVKVLVRRMII